jgi:hypothetical protein
MAIEIKQLVIKSSIADDDDEAESDETLSAAAIKHEILSECRRLILDMLKDRGQR